MIITVVLMCSCDCRSRQTGMMTAEDTNKESVHKVIITQSFAIKFGLYFGLMLCLSCNPVLVGACVKAGVLVGACVKAGVRFACSYCLNMSSGMFEMSSHVLCFVEYPST